MKRDPNEAALEKWKSEIKWSRIKPRWFWKQCDKCKMEYRKELIYRLTYDALPGASFHMQDIYGCNHCFSNIDEFKSYCNKKYIEPIARLLFGVDQQ